MDELTAVACTVGTLELGECARWDEVRQRLYFVDVPEGMLYEAAVDGAQVEVLASYEAPGYLTAVAPLAGPESGFVVAAGQMVARLRPDGSFVHLCEPERRNAPGVRMNDGACDPQGRFFVGSMAYGGTPGAGSLYCVGPDGSTRRTLSDLTISNGIGWSPDGSLLYHADTGARQVRVFDFDGRTGEISGQRVLLETDPAVEGAPDGLCVDREGGVWVALWGGSEVRRLEPDGTTSLRVRVPASQPSSCALGGSSGSALYVTTARRGLSSEELGAQPEAGSLFYAEVGVSGLPLGRFGAGPEGGTGGGLP